MVNKWNEISYNEIQQPFMLASGGGVRKIRDPKVSSPAMKHELNPGRFRLWRVKILKDTGY